jgi:hypothetical protein
MIRIVNPSTYRPGLAPAVAMLCPCGRTVFVAETDGQPYDVAHFDQACEAVKKAATRAAYLAECTDPLTGKKG